MKTLLGILLTASLVVNVLFSTSINMHNKMEQYYLSFLSFGADDKYWDCVSKTIKLKEKNNILLKEVDPYMFCKKKLGILSYEERLNSWEHTVNPILQFIDKIYKLA